MDAILDVFGWIVSAPFILLGWIIVGAIAGDLARRFMGSSDRTFFADLILGVIGAIIGGLLAGVLGIGRPDGGLSLVIVNLIISTIGAALMIGLRRTMVRTA